MIALWDVGNNGRQVMVWMVVWGWSNVLRDVEEGERESGSRANF
jgi:hypothetical protein